MVVSNDFAGHLLMFVFAAWLVVELIVLIRRWMNLDD